MNIQKINRIKKPRPRCTASTLTGSQCKKTSDKTCTFCNVHKKQLENKTPIECCICKDPGFDSPLKCGHYVHRHCVRSLVFANRTDRSISHEYMFSCPICRKRMSTAPLNISWHEDLEDLFNLAMSVQNL